MKKFIFLITFILLSTKVFGGDFVLKDVVTWMGPLDKSISVAWCPVPNATKYNVRILHVERNYFYFLGITPNTSYTFKLPKVGHYIAQVQSCTETGSCSSWATTDSSQFVISDNCTGTGNPVKPFWIYGYLPPPGNPVIQ